MADTYWDPGNLLQITEPEGALEVQCVGRARSQHDARCRWTVCGSNATAILRKVQELALSPPSKVTQQDIESLAKLCHCSQFHSGQWPKAAERWKPVVAKAAKHHERSSKGQDPAVNELQLSVQHQLSTTEGRLRAVETELEDAKITESMLAKELVVTRQLLDEEEIKTMTLEETAKEMERRVRQGADELVEAEQLLEEARTSMAEKVALQAEQKDRLVAEEREKTTRLEHAIRHLEHQLSQANVQAEHLLNQEKAKTRLLDETRTTLIRQLSEAKARSAERAAEADSARRGNETLSRDNAAAASQFARLQTDLDGVRAEIRRRTDNGLVLERELQMARVDNQALLSTHSQLMDQNTALCVEIAALETSLARSWPRRLRAWVDKASPSKSQTMDLQAATQALQHGLEMRPRFLQSHNSSTLAEPPRRKDVINMGGPY